MAMDDDRPSWQPPGNHHWVAADRDEACRLFEERYRHFSPDSQRAIGRENTPVESLGHLVPQG
jgi:hypothetical protein